MRLTREGCRKRQRRLLRKMVSDGVSVSVLCDPRHVLYFSGFEVPAGMSSVLLLRDSGRAVLIAPSAEEGLPVDEIILVEPHCLHTLHLDHGRRVFERAREGLGEPGGLVAIDKGSGNAYFGTLTDDLVDLSPTLFELRRAKDPDELELLKKAIEITEACYARARQIIQPGISELEVYQELYVTAVRTAGEKLPALGNDFQCASPGGPPRTRAAQGGELYILDLSVVWGGYYADSARTFSVGGDPSPEQIRAWAHIAQSFGWFEENVRAGVSCKRTFDEVSAYLKGAGLGDFPHHLGHGVGLAPHERPNLNPHWNHIFEEGDLFTVEPGLYSESLKCGIRLEENYLATDSGLEKLTSFPLEL